MAANGLGCGVPRYSRAPSPAFAALLTPGAFLSTLLQPRKVFGLQLDFQFREADHLHLYCGLARVLDASWSRGKVRIAADPAYSKQNCGARLFRDWTPGEEGLSKYADTYLHEVGVKLAFLRREGVLQAAWARVSEPWVPFDREAVLGYSDAAERDAARTFPQMAAARSELVELQQAGGWAELPEPGGAEVDQLAVDPDGRLVLLELKNVSTSAGAAYYSPYQLLQYVYEWHGALPAVRDQLSALIQARVLAGLTPAGLPALTGELRPAIGFGDALGSDEVRDRFEQVRTVVNRHLPPGVCPVEAWAIDGNVPRRVA